MNDPTTIRGQLDLGPAARRQARRQARRLARRARHRAPRGTLIAALVITVLAIAFLTLPLFGVKTYVISGGSMDGAIDRGALIFTKTVPVSSLQVGDIITYRPPETSRYVTHRIVSIEHREDGAPVFKTKGDFNESADPWAFTLDQPKQAKYLAQVPYLGYAFALLDLPVVRAFMLAVPALIVALVLFVMLWRRTGRAKWAHTPATAIPEADYLGDPLKYRRVDRRRIERKGGRLETVMRRLILFLIVAAVLAGGALVQVSGASFNSSSMSRIGVTSDRIQSWLNLYSQSTDPDGLTGYALRQPAGVPAATGTDATLAVDLGEVRWKPPTDFDRVFTIKTPSSFPTGTSVTVTASLVADPATGQQPIIAVGFAPVGTSGTYTNPISLGVNQKRQLNLRVEFSAKRVTWNPTILITVTYTGLTATYYRYSVPVTAYSN